MYVYICIYIHLLCMPRSPSSCVDTQRLFLHERPGPSTWQVTEPGCFQPRRVAFLGRSAETFLGTDGKSDSSDYLPTFVCIQCARLPSRLTWRRTQGPAEPSKARVMLINSGTCHTVVGCWQQPCCANLPPWQAASLSRLWQRQRRTAWKGKSRNALT